MASIIKVYEDITIALTYDGDVYIDAIIDSYDNNGSTKYLVDTDYYVRLYKSSRDVQIETKSNIGSIVLNDLIIGENISNEKITFTGDKNASANKIIFGNFQYSSEGRVYDEDLELITPVISFTEGSKNIRVPEQIFGIYNMSYYSEYSLYRFRSSIMGNMLLTFIGS